MSHRGTRVLRLDALARVEGEAALHLCVQEETVTDARMRIYEPTRFFEAFLIGRAHAEPQDITARICGICPVAHQMSARQAIENACGVTVEGPLAELGRLLYCGEWIESHTLHIYLLHAPDFRGRTDAVDLARDHRAAVERGLRIKQTGNAILEQLGGRPIHPVNVRVGGFYHTPAPEELRPPAERLRQAHDDALETVRRVAAFDSPDAGSDHDLLAPRDPGRYAIDSGTPTVIAPHGRMPAPREFPVSDLEQHVHKEQVPHSTALTAALDGRRYLTGPLARYAVNGRWLHPVAAEAARDAGLGDPVAGDNCANPFRSIVVRAVEVEQAVVCWWYTGGTSAELHRWRTSGAPCGAMARDWSRSWIGRSDAGWSAGKGEDRWHCQASGKPGDQLASHAADDRLCWSTPGSGRQGVNVCPCVRGRLSGARGGLDLTGGGERTAPRRQPVLCPHRGPTRSHSLPHWSMRRRSRHHRVAPPAPNTRPVTARVDATPRNPASTDASVPLGGGAVRFPCVFVQRTIVDPAFRPPSTRVLSVWVDPSARVQRTFTRAR